MREGVEDKTEFVDKICQLPEITCFYLKFKADFQKKNMVKSNKFDMHKTHKFEQQFFIESQK